jgi:Fn3-like domain from Purple Acid Phosphatase
MSVIRCAAKLIALALMMCHGTAAVQPRHATAAEDAAHPARQHNRMMRAGSLHSDTFEQHNPIELYRAVNVRLGDQSQASISVNSTVLRSSGEWVEVCWHGVGFPAADDYVALMVLADAAMNETAPAKYQWCAMSESHLRHGRGCLKFRLLNMRQSMRFVLLRNGFEYPTVAAGGEDIGVDNPNEPTSGHLALTSNQGQVSRVTLDWPFKCSCPTHACELGLTAAPFS